MGGQNLADTRSNPLEFSIGAKNVKSLAPAWTFTTHGDVSATPAVVGGAVYFPDWGGYLYKVDAATGTAIWSRQISSYDGVTGSVSRTSPAVSDGVVYIGDQSGAHLLAISASTGDLLWSTQLDSHPAAVLTQSPVVFNKVVYEGVSSIEETLAGNASYPCCTFRGSMVAVDAATGKIIWKTYTIPPNGGVPGGYSGGAIWSGTPAINPATGTLYVSTGNNYEVPASVTSCEQAGNSAGQCLAPDDHIDAILAINMANGAIKWVAGEPQFDTWNDACLPFFAPNNCPTDPGHDFDFASGVNLLTIPGPSGTPELVVGAGQKSGVYWAINASTGKILWSAAVGPGAPLGGIQWGTATDSHRIYVAEADSNHIPYSLPNGTTISSGSIAALNPATGKVLWQVPDPTGNIDMGPLSTANGVVYVPSMSGYMYALDAATGEVLWSFLGKGSSNAGPAIVGDEVFWGNGYAHIPAPGFTGSTTFYAFKLPDSQNAQRPAARRRAI